MHQCLAHQLIPSMMQVELFFERQMPKLGHLGNCFNILHHFQVWRTKSSSRLVSSAAKLVLLIDLLYFIWYVPLYGLDIIHFWNHRYGSKILGVILST